MLVIAMLVAHYPMAAPAFGSMPDCPMEKMADGTMKDCCKDKGSKQMQCPCGSCAGCMTAPAALAEGFMLNPPVLQPAPEQLSVRVLSQLTLPPGFRPPDFLA